MQFNTLDEFAQMKLNIRLLSMVSSPPRVFEIYPPRSNIRSKLRKPLRSGINTVVLPRPTHVLAEKICGCMRKYPQLNVVLKLTKVTKERNFAYQ